MQLQPGDHPGRAVRGRGEGDDAGPVRQVEDAGEGGPVPLLEAGDGVDAEEEQDLGRVAKLVLEETGLLPHLNPGVMSWAELQRLKPVAPSMGMMLETTATRLWSEKGGPHYGSPDKEPAVRLRVPVTLRGAGMDRTVLDFSKQQDAGEDYMLMLRLEDDLLDLMLACEAGARQVYAVDEGGMIEIARGLAFAGEDRAEAAGDHRAPGRQCLHRRVRGAAPLQARGRGQPADRLRRRDVRVRPSRRVGEERPATGASAA